MNTYLVIITTVLVITQVIRIIQNTISLHRNNKVLKAQLSEFEEVTNEDMQRRRRVDILLEKYLSDKI